MSAGIAVAEQRALGYMVLAVLAPCLPDLGPAVVDTPIRVDHRPVLERYGGCTARFREDLGPAVVDTPIRVDHRPVLERYGGCTARFREEACHKLFCNAL